LYLFKLLPLDAAHLSGTGWAMLRPHRDLFISLGLLLTLAAGAPAGEPRSVVVDASKPAGTIRSLQGVNLGPLHTQAGLPDLTAQFRDLRGVTG
jgi:hypothetical protein